MDVQRTFRNNFFYFFYMYSLVIVVLQVKLNENEKCCFGYKISFILIYYFQLTFNLFQLLTMFFFIDLVNYNNLVYGCFFFLIIKKNYKIGVLKVNNGMKCQLSPIKSIPCE